MQNDPENCGACGHRCGAQACNAGACGPAESLVPVAAAVSASGTTAMSDLALDGTSVYWGETTTSGGAVYRAPASGGAGVLVASDPNPRRFLLSGKTLFFNSGSFGTGNTAVRSVPTGGGAVTTLATNTNDFMSIAGDAATLYWTTAYPNSVTSMPMAGAVPTVLSARSALAASLCVDATNLYWIESGGIYSMPKGGGTPAALVTGVAADLMILQGSWLYYSTNHGPGSGNNALYRIAVVGGAPTRIASVLLVTTMATDGTTIYWSDGQSDLNIIRRAPAAGGSQFVSLTGYVTTARWSALDAQFVYWNDGRAIYKTAR